MPRRLVLLGLATVMVCAGCFPVSLEPLYTGHDLLHVPEAVGAWVEDGDDSGVLVLRAAEGHRYELTFLENDGPEAGVFDVHFLVLGDHLYWDMVPREWDGEDELYQHHWVPAHGFARVAVERDELRLSWMRAGWLERAIEEGRVEIAHAMASDDRILLTAPTEGIQALLLAHAGDGEAFSEEPDNVFHRLGSE